MEHFPWFPLFADDFIAGTVDLSPNEFTAYFRSLCFQWGKGGLPINDERRMLRITGLLPDEYSEVATLLMRKFPDGKNPKMEEIRSDQVHKRDVNTSNGKRGGRPRKNRNETETITESKPNPKPNQNPTPNRNHKLNESIQSQSQSQSQSKEERSKNPEPENILSASADRLHDPSQDLLENLKTVRASWGHPFSGAELSDVGSHGVLAAWAGVPASKWKSFRELLSEAKTPTKFRTERWGGMIPKRSTVLSDPATWIDRIDQWENRPGKKRDVPDYQKPKLNGEQANPDDLRKAVAESLTK